MKNELAALRRVKELAQSYLEVTRGIEGGESRVQREIRGDLRAALLDAEIAVQRDATSTWPL